MKQSTIDKVWAVFSITVGLVMLYHEMYFLAGFLISAALGQSVLAAVSLRDEAVKELNEYGYHLVDGKTYKLTLEEDK